MWIGDKTLSIQDMDVLYLKLPTTGLVILNRTKGITDLSEKRSNMYCDR